MGQTGQTGQARLSGGSCGGRGPVRPILASWIDSQAIEPEHGEANQSTTNEKDGARIEGEEVRENIGGKWKIEFVLYGESAF